MALGADISKREGSRAGVLLFGEVRVFHRPHPSPATQNGPQFRVGLLAQIRDMQVMRRAMWDGGLRAMTPG